MEIDAKHPLGSEPKKLAPQKVTPSSGTQSRRAEPSPVTRPIVSLQDNALMCDSTHQDSALPLTTGEVAD